MTDSEAATLGDYLKDKREAAGLSLRAAARKIGTSDRYLARLESGVQSNPTVDMLQRISEAYGFNLDEAFSTLGVQLNKTLPEPRVYFRRKFGVSEDDAETMAKLIEKYHETEEVEDGEYPQGDSKEDH